MIQEKDTQFGAVKEYELLHGENHLEVMQAIREGKFEYQNPLAVMEAWVSELK